MTLPLRPITAKGVVMLLGSQAISPGTGGVELLLPTDVELDAKADKIFKDMVEFAPYHLPGETVKLSTAEYKVGPRGNFIRL